MTTAMMMLLLLHFFCKTDSAFVAFVVIVVVVVDRTRQEERRLRHRFGSRACDSCHMIVVGPRIDVSGRIGIGVVNSMRWRRETNPTCDARDWL